MLKTIIDMIECPVCLEPMVVLIKQCTKGHSICEKCTQKLKHCPLCQSALTNARNFQLEKVIASLKQIELTNVCPCKYFQKGCQVNSGEEEIESHVRECKKRRYECEGKEFMKWVCQWKGNHDIIVNHLRYCHDKLYLMQDRDRQLLKIDLTANFRDMDIISFNDGEELFWFKHIVDVAEKRVIWIFQYIGPKVEAAKYYYEFTIRGNPVKSSVFKDNCQNDATSVDEIINEGKCVSIPFNVIKSHQNKDSEIEFSFHIGKIIPTSSAEFNTKRNVTQNIPDSPGIQRNNSLFPLPNYRNTFEHSYPISYGRLHHGRSNDGRRYMSNNAPGPRPLLFPLGVYPEYPQIPGCDPHKQNYGK